MNAKQIKLLKDLINNILWSCNIKLWMLLIATWLNNELLAYSENDYNTREIDCHVCLLSLCLSSGGSMFETGDEVHIIDLVCGAIGEGRTDSVGLLAVGARVAGAGSMKFLLD